MKVQKRIRGGKVRWVARYVGSDGKERTKTFEREKDAKTWKKAREAEVASGDWIDPKSQEITVAQLWPSWQAAAGTEGTGRVRALAGRNLGRLADIPIGKLRASDVRTWQQQLRKGRPWVKGCKGLKYNTVRSWAGQLAGCLAMAVGDGLLRKSPCDGAQIRRKGARAVTRAELLTTEQLWHLVDAAHAGKPDGIDWVAKQPTLARMIIVGAATGLRSGELAGLRVRSVDYLRKEAVITEQSKSATAEFEWAPLKSEASHRKIPLPQVAIDAIAAELAANPCEDRSMPIFRTAKGQMWHSGTVAYAFRGLRKRCGLGPEVSWHSLRHLYASTLIQSGASVKTVQDRLGHAPGTTTTMDVYIHLWPGEDDRTRDAIGDALDRGERTGRDQTGTDGRPGGPEDENGPASGEADGAVSPIRKLS